MEDKGMEALHSSNCLKRLLESIRDSQISQMKTKAVSKHFYTCTICTASHKPTNQDTMNGVSTENLKFKQLKHRHVQLKHILNLDRLCCTTNYTIYMHALLKRYACTCTLICYNLKFTVFSRNISTCTCTNF